MSDADPDVSNGLVTLDEGHLAVLTRLDGAICDWARACGARQQRFPALQSAADLQRIDYFANFPHLGLAVAPIAQSELTAVTLEAKEGGVAIPSRVLEAPRFMLPSAACYPVYSQLRGRTLTAPSLVTTVQQCFRNEDRYEGLRRLWAFTMREIIIVGALESVRSFIQQSKDWISTFGGHVGLTLHIRPATDPFFDRQGSRALMQHLFTVKEEFLHDDSVAVSSVNFHRNFFAEKWDIRLQDGSFAYSACVAFGLERWLGAFLDRNAGNCAEALRAIDVGSHMATERLRSTPPAQVTLF